MERRLLITLVLTVFAGCLNAQDTKVGLVPRVINYFANSNKPKDKPFDCSVIAGPFYNSTTSFAIGGGISAQYSMDSSDSLLNKSNLSVLGKVSIKGMVEMEVNGNNYMKGDRSRWHYRLRVASSPMYFWGIGYDMGIANENKTKYKQVKVSFKPDYVFRLCKNLYFGPVANLKYAYTYDFANNALIGYQNNNIFSVGVGASLQYDSRDFALNAYRGQYLKVEYLSYPKFANNYQFNSSEIFFSTYHPLWKKAVLAVEYHSLFNFGSNVPWTMLAQVAEDNGHMRGYYQGRYCDKNIVEAQLEIRQRLVKRFGVVAFAGAANVFGSFDEICMRKTLPNYGLGVRWEFKERVNVRLDVGMTKNKPGVIVNINEAF